MRRNLNQYTAQFIAECCTWQSSIEIVEKNHRRYLSRIERSAQCAFLAVTSVAVTSASLGPAHWVLLCCCCYWVNNSWLAQNVAWLHSRFMNSMANKSFKERRNFSKSINWLFHHCFSDPIAWRTCCVSFNCVSIAYFVNCVSFCLFLCCLFALVVNVFF